MKPNISLLKKKNTYLKDKIDFFLDIGTCWGIYSLRLAGIFKDIQILSFDPIKKNIYRLKQSIKKNKFLIISIA